MTEENEIKNETLEILKILVEKIENLEKTVYNDDNVLMKAGFVTTTSPTPKMSVNGGNIPDADMISKMSWEDINKYMDKMGA
mgnify:FL=1|tara:strand:+ start:3562 stop:3807 length:246 start_codon:yes stop_codon:yes gene_type:complete